MHLVKKERDEKIENDACMRPEVSSQPARATFPGSEVREPARRCGRCDVFIRTAEDTQD